MENELICIIPMRSGSLRLKHKNRKELCGKELYKYTVEQAISIKEIDTIYIVTDDHEIIEACLEYEKKDIRIKTIVEPQYLATPDTPIWAVIDYCCQREPDNAVILLLQATSPLRTSKDVLNSLKLFESYGQQMGLISGCWIRPNHEIKINGAVYIHYLGTIQNTKTFIYSGMIVYLMPKERSIDIDTLEDFKEAERLMKKRLEENAN